MALIDIIKRNNEPPVDPNKLNSQELQLALQLLKEVSIKGENVQVFYNLVVKLQNQYLEQSNQK